MSARAVAPTGITPELLLEVFDLPVTFHRCLVPITGGVTAALMLSQAIWTAQTIEGNGDGWFSKSRDQWTEETGLSRWEQIVHIVLPGAMPGFFVGLRFAAGGCLMLLVVAEQINSSAGIGYLINNARDFMRTDIIVVCLLVYTILGLTADFLVRSLEARVLRWRPALIKS